METKLNLEKSTFITGSPRFKKKSLIYIKKTKHYIIKQKYMPESYLKNFQVLELLHTHNINMLNMSQEIKKNLTI